MPTTHFASVPNILVTQKPLTGGAAPDVDQLVVSWKRYMRAQNLSLETQQQYLRTVRYLWRFLAEQGMPLSIEAVTREHVETYIVWLLEHRASSSARTRYAALRSWFRWLVDEGEIPASPMARMHEPKVVDRPPAVLSDEQVKKLLKVCEGTDFAARRDLAVVRVMLDTGARVGEMIKMRVEDIDWEGETILVRGKGLRDRYIPIGTKTAAALDRYLRARRRHRCAEDAGLWLGKFGALAYSAMRQLLKNRAEQAGIGHVHPHQLRHTFADLWLSGDGKERELLTIGGWRSAEVARRYGRSADARRAREAHRKFSPGDRF